MDADRVFSHPPSCERLSRYQRHPAEDIAQILSAPRGDRTQDSVRHRLAGSRRARYQTESRRLSSAAPGKKAATANSKQDRVEYLARLTRSYFGFHNPIVLP